MSDQLDTAFLDELLDGDRDFGDELFAAFEEASTQWVTEAAAACGEGKAEQAIRAFHTLKGSAASVGLVDLRDLAKELERLAKADELSACAARLDDLRRLVEQGRTLLSRFLESL